MFKCVHASLVPKLGDRDMVQNYCIDLTKGNEPIDMADYLWKEILLASTKKNKSFPHGPYIQTLIDAWAPFGVDNTTKHKMWTPRDGDKAKGMAPKRSSRKTKHILEPTRRLGHFFARTRKALMESCTFNATQVVTMESHHYKKVKGLKDRLCARGILVSEDEDPPTVSKILDFGFPDEAEYPDYFEHEPSDSNEDDDATADNNADD